ncbi:DUF6888 family protein [Nostoc spongiaeforme]|uniref:DUF6888 family protein n=1 Tax=Nostoc spongiaeforme TaxID=502487 RepID=UPI0036F4071B
MICEILFLLLLLFLCVLCVLCGSLKRIFFHNSYRIAICQSLTNTFTPIYIVRLDEQTGNVFILAGDNREIEIYRNGLWRFL